MRRVWLSAVALSVLPFSLGLAQPRQQLGRLLGVFDDATGQPVVGAEVVDIATGTKALTSVSGAISLAFLEPGTTVLEVRKIGYKNRMLTVVVSPNDTVSITLTLVPLGQTLPEVVTKGESMTTGKLATFEQHRAEGFGHFLTREQLAKMESHLTSDALRSIPGLKLMNVDPRRPSLWVVGTSRGTASFLRNGPSGKCLAAVMLDGVMVYSGSDGEDLFDINSVKPEEIAGVEYYAGGASMPLRYNSTRATCGLVVIWTR
jgi:hypothetical protein